MVVALPQHAIVWPTVPRRIALPELEPQLALQRRDNRQQELQERMAGLEEEPARTSEPRVTRPTSLYGSSAGRDLPCLK